MINNHSAREDDALQGLSLEAQLIYLRAMRLVVSFETGCARVSYGFAKRVLEFIPDKASKTPARRTRDVSNSYIRVRFAELERAGLCKRTEQPAHGMPPIFFLPLAPIGKVCLNEEQQSLSTANNNKNTHAPRAVTEFAGSGTIIDQGGRTAIYHYINKYINKPGYRGDNFIRHDDVFDLFVGVFSDKTMSNDHNTKVIGKIVGLKVCHGELVSVVRSAVESKGVNGFGPSYVFKVLQSRRGSTHAKQGGRKTVSKNSESVVPRASVAPDGSSLVGGEPGVGSNLKKMRSHLG